MVNHETDTAVLCRSPWPCPPPTPELLRQRIWHLAQQGLSAAACAASLGLPVRTVQRLRARFRQADRPTPPDYGRCGRPAPVPFAALRAHTLACRQAHPRWGAGRLRVALRERFPHQRLPHPSTLRRWCARAHLSPRPARRAPPPAPRATRPHQTGQRDAAEQKSLRSGQKVCWLRLVDEASGAALFSRVFAQGSWPEVGGPAVQAALRRAFARWGRPDGLRVDNGTPWVCPGSDLPSDLELWLAGLEVALHRNRPRHPPGNGAVERGQRTAAAWAEPGLCDTPEQLQRRLDEEDRVHREAYLFDGRQTRRQAFPDLLHSGRAYAEGGWEGVCWDLPAALGRLAAAAVERKVDRDGEVSLYDRPHWVGKAYSGQVVQDFIHGHRNCRVVTQYDFAEGVPDQNDVHAGLVHQARRRVIVGGQASQPVAS